MSKDLTVSKEINPVVELDPVSEDLVKKAEFALTGIYMNEEHDKSIHVYDVLPQPIKKVDALTKEKDEIIAKLEDKEVRIGFENEMKLAIEEDERQIALEIIKNPKLFGEEQVGDSMKLLKKWGRKENIKVLEESRELNEHKEKHAKNKVKSYTVLAITLVAGSGVFLAIPLITKISVLFLPFFFFLMLGGLFFIFTTYNFREQDDAMNEKLEALHTSQRQVKTVANAIKEINNEEEKKIQKKNFEDFRDLSRDIDAMDN